MGHLDGKLIDVGRRPIPCPWDWDGDGDMDLMVGNDDGQVLLYIRHKDNPAAGFGPGRRLTTTGGILRVGAYAAPTIADWDGDGLEDLIVGENTGQVNLFRNLGKKGNPQFAPGRILVSRVMRSRLKYGQTAKYPGSRVHPCVTDWNGDGHLDLLLGDCTFQEGKLPDPPPVSKEEMQAAFTAYQKNLKEYIRLGKAPKGESPTAQAERLKLREAVRKVYRSHYAIYRKGRPRTQIHGWVWLYLRRPVH